MATVQGSQVSCGQGECGEDAGRGEEAEQEVGQAEGGGLQRRQAEVARQLRGAGRGQAEDDRRVGLPQALQARGRAQGLPGPGPEAAPRAQRGAGEVGPSILFQDVSISAANRLIGEVVQSRRRPLLGPSPG